LASAEETDVTLLFVGERPVDPRYGRFSGSKRCRLPHGLIGQ
jgi:hypothetical protein